MDLFICLNAQLHFTTREKLFLYVTLQKTPFTLWICILFPGHRLGTSSDFGRILETRKILGDKIRHSGDGVCDLPE